MSAVLQPERTIILAWVILDSAPVSKFLKLSMIY